MDRIWARMPSFRHLDSHPAHNVWNHVNCKPWFVCLERVISAQLFQKENVQRAPPSSPYQFSLWCMASSPLSPQLTSELSRHKGMGVKEKGNNKLSQIQTRLCEAALALLSSNPRLLTDVLHHQDELGWLASDIWAIYTIKLSSFHPSMTWSMFSVALLPCQVLPVPLTPLPFLFFFPLKHANARSKNQTKTGTTRRRNPAWCSRTSNAEHSSPSSRRISALRRRCRSPFPSNLGWS